MCDVRGTRKRGGHVPRSHVVRLFRRCGIAEVRFCACIKTSLTMDRKLRDGDGRQDAGDRYDHQQFNQRKTLLAPKSLQQSQPRRALARHRRSGRRASVLRASRDWRLAIRKPSRQRHQLRALPTLLRGLRPAATVPPQIGCQHQRADHHEHYTRFLHYLPLLSEQTRSLSRGRAAEDVE